MELLTWGDKPKSQVDPQLITEAITQSIQAHDDDPDAHLETGQSLQSHKASEIIDHLAESIVNDKIKSIARASTAIVKIPTTTIQQKYFPTINFEEGTFTPVGAFSNIIDIINPSVNTSDSNYFYFATPFSGAGYIQFDGPVLPAGQKIYKMRFKIRCKLLNHTTGDGYTEIGFADGVVFSFNATTSFATYTFETYFLMDSVDKWQEISGSTIREYPYSINYGTLTGPDSHDQLAISSFYIEADVVSLADQEDYFYLGTALDYVNSLGGGNIYIANGNYTMADRSLIPAGNVRISGQSPYGVVLTFPDVDEYFQLGNNAGIIYSTGTCTFTNGSAVVTGAGTTWTTLNTVGHYILEKRSGRFYKIISRASNTSITVDKVYRGQTVAGNAYIIKDLVANNIVESFSTNSGFDLRGTLDCQCISIIVTATIVRYSYIENLIMDSCTFNQINTSAQSDYVFNSSWINCYFINALSTCMYFTINNRFNLFFNNLFSDCANQCIIIFGNGLIVQNNIIVNAGFALGTGFSAILLGSTSFENQVMGNNITFSGNNGIGSQAGANFNMVVNNVCLHNLVVGVSNVGANSITANNIV